MKAVKIVDSNALITKGSKADQYWKQNGWDKLFKKVRPGMKLPKGFETNDPNVLVQKFNMKAIGFGNWVTLEDRLNYLYSLIFAMYDLNKVLKFGYNMGFGELAITFGARGYGGALAHYEPGTNIINISRYERGFMKKEYRFFGTGGVGSLAHEYGHFLDYFAGGFIEKNNQVYSLTNGRSTSRSRVGAEGEMRTLCDDILGAIIWKTPEKKLSPYYERLTNAIDNGPMGEYWIRRNELFARAFEVYISYKMKSNGIKNYLLVHPKYEPSVYLKESEMAKLAPKFDKLISVFKSKF